MNIFCALSYLYRDCKLDVAEKRCWYNNGTEQKLIPLDEDTDWTKGKLPKGDK